MNKKAVELSMNVIIISAIALLVLVVLSVIFLGRIGASESSLEDSVTISNMNITEEVPIELCVPLQNNTEYTIHIRNSTEGFEFVIEGGNHTLIEQSWNNYTYLLDGVVKNKTICPKNVTIQIK